MQPMMGMPGMMGVPGAGMDRDTSRSMVQRQVPRACGDGETCSFFCGVAASHPMLQLREWVS